MIKAIIFDFDGVIVDSEKTKFNDLNKILKGLGYKQIKDFSNFIGKKTGKILTENFSGISEDEIVEITELRRKNLAMKISPLIDGVKTFIENKAKNLSLAIVTGTERDIVIKHLLHYSLDNFFHTIVGGEDFDNSKPDPEPYIVALDRLGLVGSEVVVLEDSQAGIDSAKSAGCRVFGFEKYMLNLRNADMYFRKYGEIEDFI